MKYIVGNQKKEFFVSVTGKAPAQKKKFGKAYDDEVVEILSLR